MKKMRIDQRMVEEGLAPSRSKAQALVMAGCVFLGTQKIEKPSQMVGEGVSLTLKEKDHPFVGRGGVKLKAALDHFQVKVAGQICLDIGASTGGFTDCLLQQGAKKVYALDVGHNQIDWKLRQDPRVVVLEKINFRNYDLKDIVDAIDVVTVDVSFISLKLIVPKVIELFKRGRDLSALIALIKPQFEVGREFVAKGGIVKDPEKQKECIEGIAAFCEGQEIAIRGIIPSPITGTDGNQEYLMMGNYRG